MNSKTFSVFQRPNGGYDMCGSEDFYAFLAENGEQKLDGKWSFKQFYWRLFGLSPYEYYSMLISKYNATCAKGTFGKYVDYWFSSSLDAEKFCKDLSFRWEIIFKRISEKE